MLLTITSTTEPATDLGFLLHKNPAAVRTVDLAFGKAHVFYPEASETRCTAALLVEIDPVGLVRRGRGSQFFSLADYVNDRPYVASSFMSVAIAKLFGTALSGRSDDRPELADTPIPLEAHLPAVPCRGGDALIRELFEPLGYEVQTTPIALDAERPDWGDSRYLALTLRGVVRLRDLLRHLYVLLPVMDDDKHYWVERGEIDKLLAKGEEWLAQHPSRELITRRYLRHRMPLMREALARLSEDVPEPEEPAGDDEGRLERTLSLAEQRIGAILSVLRAADAHTVLDLGCGSGKLLAALWKDAAFQKIAGSDVSIGALEAAERRLHVEQMSPRQRERLTLFQSALTYRDRRFEGYDAAVAHGGDRAPRPRASAGAATRPVRSRSTPRGDRHDAERRIQRAIRDVAGGHAAASRPPIRVDARRVRGVGERRRRRSRLSRSVPARRHARSRGRRADADGGVRAMTEIAVPELSLVVLVGVSGSGKSTFAARHFKPTEVVSSDACRALGGRRPERPIGHQGGVRASCTRSPARAWRSGG